MEDKEAERKNFVVQERRGRSWWEEEREKWRKVVKRIRFLGVKDKAVGRKEGEEEVVGRRLAIRG